MRGYCRLMKFLLASGNPGKVAGVRDASAGFDIEWVGLAELAASRGVALPEEPVEDAPDFEGNALLKARYYAVWSGMPTVSDDSGLVVDALAGDPGVRSARYAAADVPADAPRDVRDPANNARLIRELTGVDAAERAARFVCVIAAVWPDGTREPITVRGEVEGRIIDTPRGTHGFGYDPHFELTTGPFAGRTTAELAPAEKTAVSHRGSAVRRFAQAVGASRRR